MKFVKFVIILAIGAGVFIAGPYIGHSTYMAGWWRLNYPSRAEYPVQGLDVSHHQGEIDWAQIPKERFSFVYMKATEGGDFIDKNLLKNWNGAKKAGLKVGAYHFFTLCREGKEQAANFIKAVPGGTMDLPPVIDLEFGGNCSKRPSRGEFTLQLKDYIEKIEAHYGRRPVLYVTYEFYYEYVFGTFGQYPLWVRDIWSKPDIAGWHMWQYANNGRVSGINGPVDLNVMVAAPK